MVITFAVKNLKERNGIFEFRMVVPKDCQESVGKSEITQSLKTKEPAEAARLAKGLTDDWKKKFEEIRKPSSSPILAIQSKTNETVDDFRKTLFDYMNQNLPALLDKQSKTELYELSLLYQQWMMAVTEDEPGTMDLSKELGIRLPLSKKYSPGMTRKLNKAIVEALGYIRSAIDDEYGKKISQKIDEDLLDSDAHRIAPKEIPTQPSLDETNIFKVMNLMLDAKNMGKTYKGVIESEVKCLQEWLGGKSDITAITKTDLVDYARNCLPYLPKNMNKIALYKGKSLVACVDMVKGNVTKFVPISHQTCKNRFAKAQTVFSYAKDHLGIITINPAKGITIPEVRIKVVRERGYTDDELSEMWKALEIVYKTVNKRPERYWIPIIGLYHGFRLNEICSLRLKDIYQHADGTFVIDVNGDGEKRSVKNKSSVRIVPVHPYLLESLCFNEYLDNQKVIASADALLFPNLTYTDGQGYAKNTSVWFNKWKKTWLPVESHYKNFHSLRHTFIQQAQNQAKMTDRCNQEITGHSVAGVSDIHMIYSGRLKPKAVLKELKELKYGWEE